MRIIILAVAVAAGCSTSTAGTGQPEAPVQAVAGGHQDDAQAARASAGGAQLDALGPGDIQTPGPSQGTPDGGARDVQAVSQGATPDARLAGLDAGRPDVQAAPHPDAGISLAGYRECTQDPAQLEPLACGATFQRDPAIVCATCTIAGTSSQALGCYFRKQAVQRFVYLCVRQCSDCPR